MLTTTVILGLVTLGQVPRVAGELVPLDKAPNSVDDKYDGCRENMLNKMDTVLKYEIFANRKFARAWKKYENKKGDGELTANHVKAIAVHTDDTIYTPFNRATRTGRAKYINKTYRWYSLHFLLTDAIQILNKQTKRARTNCTTTFRCSNNPLNIRKREFRFGQIASSSTDHKVANVFGDWNFCFKIQTCEGADVSKYSKYGDHERKVLIPPYEKFKITAKRNERWCKKVFYLESIGTQSNLNCASPEVKGF